MTYNEILTAKPAVEKALATFELDGKRALQLAEIVEEINAAMKRLSHIQGRKEHMSNAEFDKHLVAVLQEEVAIEIEPLLNRDDIESAKRITANDVIQLREIGLLPPKKASVEKEHNTET